jgi:GNAT superfamily N-acetyltransferase
VADLRIAVFQEYPYLYDGDREYEEQYLKTLAESDKSLVVLAEKHGRVVGASTALPLVDADPLFAEPFHSPERYFYYGESVLLPEHRGRGIGKAFFFFREEVARSEGYERACFCAVRRPEEHPRRPAGYRDLAPLWDRQGFSKTSLTTTYPWKDLDDVKETAKVMEFWEKKL